MRDTIYLIVEGDGEIESVPLLVRRIIHERMIRYDVMVGKPRNAGGRSNILKPGGLEQLLNYLRAMPNCVGILVLLDAERDYVDKPEMLARHLSERASQLGLPFKAEIVCAVCEYESWFLASLPSLCQTIADLNPNLVYDNDPDRQCSAKEWLTRHMKDGHPYKETYHQVRMTKHLDLTLAYQRSASFRMFVGAVERLVA